MFVLSQTTGSKVKLCFEINTKKLHHLQLIIHLSSCRRCGIPFLSYPRVLKVVDVPELDHLVDTIVFPIKGKRPHSTEIAGSDLDGDCYFVSWDEDLIPSKVVPPYDYPAAPSPPLDNIGRKEMIHNFCVYNPFLVGKIHKLFNYYADRKGVACSECKTLSALFARAIDAAKTGENVKVQGHFLTSSNTHRSMIVS